MCIFCAKSGFSLENKYAYAIYDHFPVTKYHTLVIPKRHIASFFDLSHAEIIDLSDILNKQKEILDELDSSITGYNVGINCGETAGQTIFHCHIHLIPRRKSDVENPKGGIRNIIPGKGDYAS